ncbi:hypothetical protein COT42_05640 [Candidatus Saganbacteria bacterium CG08_land_8_20_14_0_20_45_16]|uniref:Septum formation initiator n=1 Tax=Candidatus Saganbacteria bacterium CG08_land_8_20_14_0_20_45_16 TaxID=2014293 RepID=A0A2H0XWZ1_UNCSA|nr:MAG: hypothetical protein COT42_05640 [Candidatus Saganbacteria bacterium CG08_land_8_20_14_0_20_45_16]
MKKMGLGLFFLLVCYFIFLIRQDIIDNLSLKRETQGVSTGLNFQQDLSKDLRWKLQVLTTSQYIEELARTRLGFVKKGETAYKVVGREDK